MTDNGKPGGGRFGDQGCFTLPGRSRCEAYRCGCSAWTVS